MMNVLLVEDEITIREGLRDTIPWKENGLHLCGEAGDGLEALERIAAGPVPDLIITDIHMPKMNGLDFIQAARATLPNVEVIVLSGYDDFQYAKKAIQLGVNGYVLKPCRTEELVQLIVSTKMKITAIRETQTSMHSIQNKWERSLPTVIEQSLLRWVRSPRQKLENRSNQLEEWNSPIRPTDLLAGIIRVDDSSGNRVFNKTDQELIRYAAFNIIQETFNPIFDHNVVVVRDGNDFIWIANPPKKQLSIQETKLSLGRLKINLEQYLRMSVSIGVGNLVGSVDDLHLSYEQAWKAIETRFYSGKGTIVLYSELAQNADGASSDATIFEDKSMLKLEQSILHHLRTMKFEDALDQTEVWLQQLHRGPLTDQSEVSLRATAFMLELQKLAQEQHVNALESNQRIVDLIKQVPNMETLEDLSTLVKKLIRSLVAGLNSQVPTHRTVQGALDIIHAKYHTNLTLDSVSKEVFVSNTYLSSLFKQELGINFLDYLHQYRIEHAKSLLRKNYKMYAVAKMVGYQEERYFSMTFKKWTGLTPTQFKKNGGAN
ncbi:two component transcriptional regulator, AraC family [Paenibacillus curdlanolyticus YK9]|uniref:Two component transcriptional regulator, AraC family n=1 Tax=Paenibacillus curdlanolyticus YK9 TaxID=717606 RepID=E0ICS4_9BACL|nr:response regulator [Paenibacillus curdlanolyticus]EFM09960.1 two component transcriptional regulator, AraC family [Paenibacillus curdlanolyticus YK9]